MVCDGIPQCLDASDEWNCYICTEAKEIELQTSETKYLSSPEYPNSYPYNVDCMWYFISNSSHFIIVRFLDLYTPSGDTISVGTGHDKNEIEKQKLLLNRKYFPNSVSFRNPVIWIRFKSDGRSSYRGFLLTVEATNESVTCEPHEFQCASGYGCFDQSLRCNAYSQCIDDSDELNCDYCHSQEFNLTTSNEVTIRTPLFASNYPSDQKCTWFITTSHPGYIYIRFASFLGLETDNDFLDIGYGTNISKDSQVLHLSGTVAPNSLSMDNEAWIRFTSNQKYGWYGFEIILERRESPVLCRETEFQCKSGYGCLDKLLICDAHPQCLHASDEQGCDVCQSKVEIQVLFNDIVNLTSPNYPLNYPRNLQCFWTLYTGNIEQFLEVRFVEFDVAEDWDFLAIGYGEEIEDSSDTSTRIAQFTGLEAPSYVIIRKSVAWISFYSHALDFYFKKFFLQLGVKQNNATCDFGEFSCTLTQMDQICLDGYQKCDGIRHCPDGIDEQRCGECGVRQIFLRTDDVTNLTSPGYPSKYRNDLICSWTVFATDDTNVLLEVVYFQMEHGYDFLMIGNGQNPGDAMSTFAALTGNIKIRTLTSSGQSVWLTIVTDGTGSRTGFHVHIRRVQHSSGNQFS
ncbi:CUB and sushi domain-containing protein 3-like [Amphiura filiformis]|uniref:CUB and sushi domain-containing protein 3-like n=1 Tax=Amphiura filiformis TaxID=82378 RepID=UPI003B21E22A